MSETISKREAARLLQISVREIERRIAAGELQAAPSPTGRHRGRPTMEILVSSLPAEKQTAWAGRAYLTQSPEEITTQTTSIRTLQDDLLCKPFRPGAAVTPHPASDVGHPLPPGRIFDPLERAGKQLARRDKLISTAAGEAQLVLEFDRDKALRLLPPELHEWASTWFNRLVDAGLLCLIDGDRVVRNGGWKKFQRQELRAGERCFYIRSKEDVVRYIAATFQVSPAFVWERCREFFEFFTYVVGQKRTQEPIDLEVVAQIFPARAKDSGGRFRPRSDAGISKTIPQPAAELLLARYGAGSRPGTDGWRPSFALVLDEYQTWRQAIIDASQNPDEHGYPEVSIYALRRLLPAQACKSDPGLVLAREGSAALRDRVTPYILRDVSNLFTHQWWIADNRRSHLVVESTKYPGYVYRPYVTWIHDVRTMYPIAFVVTIIPCALVTFRALKIGFLTFEIAPDVFYSDNGKEFRNLMIGGSGAIPFEGNDVFDLDQKALLRRFNIKHCLALPSRRNRLTGETQCHGRSKKDEPWFGAWMNTFDRQQPGACGKDPFDKPDKLYVELRDKGKLITDLEYERRLAAYVNDRIVNHPSRGLMGLSPADALKRYSREAWGLPEERALLPEQIGELISVRDKRTVKNSMVTVKIGGEERKYEHSAFFSLSGQDVDIAYDPTEPAEIFVYYNGRALGRAPEVPKLPWGSASNPQSLIPNPVSEGMRKQRLATKSAREMIVRREQAAPPLSQAEMTDIRELLIQKRGLPAPVAHAASIERVREQSIRKASPQRPQRRMTADDIAREVLKDE